jgi:hypothetical protein
VFLVAILSACAGSDKSSPIAPSPLPVVAPTIPPPAGGVGRGTIAISGINPADGATLGVGECRSGAFARTCTDEWSGTFEIAVDLEMTNAVLTAGFYDGDRLCGYGANTTDIVPAGSPVSFTIDRIVLSDDYSLEPWCQLPVTTHRMELLLWSDSSRWTNSLRQKFEHSYTFSQP